MITQSNFMQTLEFAWEWLLTVIYSNLLLKHQMEKCQQLQFRMTSSLAAVWLSSSTASKNPGEINIPTVGQKESEGHGSTGRMLTK